MRKMTDNVRKTGKRGSVLPLVVVLIVMLFLIGSGLLQLGFHARLGAIRSTSQISARAAADAGLAQALHGMNSQFDHDNPCNPDWSGHTGAGDLSDSAYGNAGYQYSVVALPGGCPYYEIISTGTTLRGQKTVHAALRVVTKYEYAIIVEEGITFKEGVLIDGYNSADTTDPGTYVKIGTNSILPGMIDLKHGVVVDGDVLVGFGGDVDTVILDRGATTGPRYPLPSPVPLERNTLPDDWAGVPGPAIVFDPCGVATITQSGDYTYNSIELPEGHTLRVGDMLNVAHVRIHIAGNLWLKHAAELRVTGMPGVGSTWSSLAIYLDGVLDAGNSNGINNETLKPGQFKLIGTGLDGVNWEIKNAGDFYGVFDAPNANLVIKQDGDIFGAVIGLSCDLRQAGNVYYDEDLRQPIEGPVGFAIDRWWEE
jgi:hypothetical protein